MIRFNCSGCGMLIQAMDAAAGKVSKCPGCGVHIVIPTAPPPAPPAPPPRRPAAAPIPAAAMQSPPVQESPFAPAPAPAAPSGGFLDDLLDSSSPPSHAPASSPDAPTRRSGAHKSKGAPPKSVAKKSMSPEAVRNLAFGAIGAGVLAGALCWLPFAGPALGLIGAALAMLTIVLSSARKNAPMGLPLAGAVVSLAGMLAGVYFTYQYLSQPPPAQVVATANPQAGTKQDAAVAEAAAKKPATGPAQTTATQFSEGALLALAGGKASDARDPMKFSLGAIRGLSAAGGDEPKLAAAADRAKIGRKGSAPKLTFGDSGSGGSEKIGDTDSTSKSADASAGGDDKSTEPAAPIKWAAADKGEGQNLGDVHVTVTKVTRGRLAIASKDPGADLTNESYLTVWLKLDNKAAIGDATYKSWMDPELAKGDGKATMADENGQDYKICPLNKGEIVAGAKPAPMIGNNSSITDAIAFALPKEEIKTLHLTLPGEAVNGLKGALHFEIPWSMTKEEESNPLIGGLGGQ